MGGVECRLEPDVGMSSGWRWYVAKKEKEKRTYWDLLGPKAVIEEFIEGAVS